VWPRLALGEKELRRLEVLGEGEMLMLLPPFVSQIITRELLYTGVTRARRKVTIVGSRALVEEAVEQRVKRASGLRPALWERLDSEDFA
jgi:ATP-dependent exoDNAse (exonuclease V) alpha subunit